MTDQGREVQAYYTGKAAEAARLRDEIIAHKADCYACHVGQWCRAAHTLDRRLEAALDTGD